MTYERRRVARERRVTELTDRDAAVRWLEQWAGAKGWRRFARWATLRDGS